jgi:hypothetical protein
MTALDAKLAGLTPLLWINLDASVARRERMESQLRAHGLQSRRIPAVDGRRTDVPGRFLAGVPARRFPNAAEIGCTLSHLRAIDTFVREYDRDCDFAVVCEDDVDFSPASHWPFEFADVLAALPGDWDCLQLAISTAADDVKGWLHRREPSEYCACAYVIRRRYAERLVGWLACDEGWDLTRLKLDHRFAHCIDHFLYAHGVTYSMPLLSYAHDLPSTIQEEALLTDVALRTARAIGRWWQTDGRHMTARELLAVDA